MIQVGLMQLVHDAASHAATRQSLIARNIANADTPGYQARDLPSFAETVRDMQSGFGDGLKATRSTHLDRESGLSRSFASVARPSEGSPDGNTVSLENEMMQSTQAEQQHQMALSVYTSARDILRSALGRGN